MANYKYISDSRIIAAAHIAMRNGKAETYDSKGEKVEYTYNDGRGDCSFAIDKEKSHSYARTIAELIKYSVTSDKCRIHYFDTNTGKNVYVLPYQTILVNNPAHELCGCLIDANTGYIIARPEKLF